MLLLRWTLFASVVGAAFIPVHAAEPAKTEIVRLAITPAVEPMPALKYQLLPAFIHRRPGNAALDYGRAIAFHAEIRGTAAAKFEEEWNKWLELPLDEFELAIKGRDLSSQRDSEAMKLVRLGALCDHCDWQLPLRDQPYFSVVLPELSELRRLARMLVLNIRLNIVEGNYDAAIGRLQIGYALARHAASEPTIVSGLVGLSIASMMDEVRLDLVQRADAPSLFWAETFLPHPLVDAYPGVEAEMYGIAMSFPALRDTPRTAAEWNADFLELMRELPPLLAMSSNGDGSVQFWEAQLATAPVLAKTAARRDELRSFVALCDRSQEEVAKMTDPQLLLEFTRLKFEHLRDDMFRLLTLPYAEVRPQLEAAEKRLAESKQNGTEIIPLAAMILPAVSSMRHAYARADRRRDVLRTIEALRLYAAKHGGALPKSLSDVTDVPLPKLDVVTGKPLEYVLEGATARLTLPDERRGDKTVLVYEITVAATK